MSPKSDTKEPKAEKPIEVKEKYYRVKFAHQSSANDTRDVELSVNGETLVIKRMEEVIIPARYKEVAEHATYQTFTQLPGQDRKITGYVNVYPFQTMGEATEEEFLKALEAGNRMARSRDQLES